MRRIELASALMMMGAIALIIFLIVLSTGTVEPTSLLLGIGLLGLGVFLRQRARRRQIMPPSRGRLLRRMLRRRQEEEDI